MAETLTPTKDPDALARDLCAALLTPREREEMARLLADLCTPAEIRTLAERWHVARLLDETELSYRDIHEATGVSTTTIVRVARFLRAGAASGLSTRDRRDRPRLEARRCSIDAAASTSPSRNRGGSPNTAASCCAMPAFASRAARTTSPRGSRISPPT